MSSNQYQVTLRFNDSQAQTISVSENESVLTAALRQDVPILHQCESGSCGSCLAQLTSGIAPMRKDMAASLVKSEQEAGMRLACMTHAESDCTLELDYDSSLGESKPTKATIFIDAIEWVSDDVIHLTAELAEEDWVDFRPGQFVQMQIPGTQQSRRYSMSSTPEHLPKLEFLIRILPEGLMSDYLRNRAEVNDTIEIEGAFGSFFLRDEHSRAPHIMIAGGTGLAPMMSMLDVIHKKSIPTPDITLSFGCLNNDSLFYTDELALRSLWMPTLETRISVDQGTAEENIVIGNPLQALQPSDVTSDDTVAYLCGPPGMISAAHDLLEELGVISGNIYAEQFIPSE